MPADCVKALQLSLLLKEVNKTWLYANQLLQGMTKMKMGMIIRLIVILTPSCIHTSITKRAMNLHVLLLYKGLRIAMTG